MSTKTIKVPVIIEATIEVVPDPGETVQSAFDLIMQELFNRTIQISNKDYVFNAEIRRLGLVR